MRSFTLIRGNFSKIIGTFFCIWMAELLSSKTNYLDPSGFISDLIPSFLLTVSLPCFFQEFIFWWLHEPWYSRQNLRWSHRPIAADSADGRVSVNACTKLSGFFFLSNVETSQPRLVVGQLQWTKTKEPIRIWNQLWWLTSTSVWFWCYF